MSKLNRKQNPVCSKCHVKIHNGKYDGISMKDLQLNKIKPPKIHNVRGEPYAVKVARTVRREAIRCPLVSYYY